MIFQNGPCQPYADQKFLKYKTVPQKWLKKCQNKKIFAFLASQAKGLFI
jgi:hypothetical protein